MLRLGAPHNVGIKRNAGNAVNMWIKFAFAALGVAAGVAAALIPAAAPYLGPAAAGLIAYAIRAPGDVSKQRALEAGADRDKLDGR